MAIRSTWPGKRATPRRRNGYGRVFKGDLQGETGPNGMGWPYWLFSLDGNTDGGLCAVGTRFVAEQSTPANPYWPIMVPQVWP